MKNTISTWNVQTQISMYSPISVFIARYHPLRIHIANSVEHDRAAHAQSDLVYTVRSSSNTQYRLARSIWLRKEMIIVFIFSEFFRGHYSHPFQTTKIYEMVHCFLIFTALWANSADVIFKDFFSLFIFNQKMDFGISCNCLHWRHLHDMSKPGDNLNEISKSIFWKKKRKKNPTIW